MNYYYGAASIATSVAIQEKKNADATINLIRRRESMLDQDNLIGFIGKEVSITIYGQFPIKGIIQSVSNGFIKFETKKSIELINSDLVLVIELAKDKE